MKIAVASNNGVKVSGHLGRCRSFLVYTVEDGKVANKETRTNTFTHHQKGGHHSADSHEHHGHSHNDLIEGLKDCEALIFSSGGWRVVNDLQNNNIKPFLTDEDNADTAVEKYISGTLIEKEDNVCRHH